MRRKRICALILAGILLFLCVPAQAASDGDSALDAFAQAVEEHAYNLDTAFSIPCDYQLRSELKKLSSVGDKKTDQLSEIMIRAGCYAYSVAYTGSKVRIEDAAYYPGWIMLRRYETGTTDKLSAREKQTLEAALALVGEAEGTNLEKERYIYDALCARTIYVTEERRTGRTGSGTAQWKGKGTFSEKDCAIGALLNGRADCDGYSDAMVLCCGLAGIPCRYIHGESTISLLRGAGDSTHMWNLVYVGGSWLMCDVTWGDQDRTEPCYLYFNIGRRNASLSYHWNTRTQYPDIAAMADFATQLMPDQQPVAVSSMTEVYLAARAAATEGKRRLTLYSPDEAFWQTDDGNFRRMLHHGGICTYSFQESGALFEISEIILPETVFRFCDSEDEILDAVEEYAKEGTNTFTLYFPPDLSGSLLADSCARLKEVLMGSRVESADSFYYSDDSGFVTLQNVSFFPPGRRQGSGL